MLFEGTFAWKLFRHRQWQDRNRVDTRPHPQVGRSGQIMIHSGRSNCTFLFRLNVLVLAQGLYALNRKVQSCYDLGIVVLLCVSGGAHCLSMEWASQSHVMNEFVWCIIEKEKNRISDSEREHVPLAALLVKIFCCNVAVFRVAYL